MKTIIISLLLMLTTPTAGAAGVKLQHLKDFDTTAHAIFVNTQVEIEGTCYVDADKVRASVEGLLTRLGFRLASMKKSHLEFATSIKGFDSGGNQPCGVRILNMARQIPKIRMLRIDPNSSSQEYRLWTNDKAETTTPGDIQALVQNQTAQDVAEFSHVLRRSKTR